MSVLSTSQRCCLPAFFTFFLVFVLMPIVIFAIAFTFAFFLRELECASAWEAYEASNGTDPPRQTAEELCELWQWFLYIIGNIVGIGNPLTNISPAHPLSKIIDLIVSVWSISILGCCLGLIGGLSSITMFVDRMNSNISRSSELFVRLSGSGAEPKKTAAPTLQDGDEGIEREAERDAAMKELLTITRVLDARLTEQQQQLHNLAEQQKELQSTLRLALLEKTKAIVESESDAGRELEQTQRRKTRVRSRSRHNGEGVVTRRATTD